MLEESELNPIDGVDVRWMGVLVDLQIDIFEWLSRFFYHLRSNNLKVLEVLATVLLRVVFPIVTLERFVICRTEFSCSVSPLRSCTVLPKTPQRQRLTDLLNDHILIHSKILLGPCISRHCCGWLILSPFLAPEGLHSIQMITLLPRKTFPSLSRCLIDQVVLSQIKKPC